MLKDVPPHLVRLASGCLDQADLAAASRACGRLSNHLTLRLGSPRAQALLLLGLALARADFPLLNDLDASPDGRLTPFEAALANRPAAEAHAAVVALVAHTLHLVATLEGEPAASTLARDLRHGADLAT